MIVKLYVHTYIMCNMHKNYVREEATILCCAELYFILNTYIILEKICKYNPYREQCTYSLRVPFYLFNKIIY